MRMGRERSLRNAVTLLVGVSLIVIGCASAGPSTTSPPPPASSGGAVPSQTNAATLAEGTSSGEVVLPTPELTSVKWGMASQINDSELPIITAMAENLPAKYGLDVQFLPFEGTTPASQALLTGQVDVIDTSGGPVLDSLLTDAPMVIVWVQIDNLTDNLYTQADIKTAADLKGKSIAISTFGAETDLEAALALKALGLTRDDVTITQVGHDSDRLAALKAGSVAASINDVTQADALTGLGFNILVKLADVKGLGGEANSALATTVTFENSHPNVMMALVGMMLQASVDMRADQNVTAQRLADAANIPLDEANADVALRLNGPWSPVDGKCSDTVMQFTQQVLTASNPQLASVDPTKACSNDVLDQLASIGFQHEVGVPGY